MAPSKRRRTRKEGSFELRHIVNPLVGFEGAVSFNLANQSYAPNGTNCALVCGQPPLEVSGKLTEFTLDWVVSMKKRNFRPFAIGGFGFNFTVPGTEPTVATSIGIVPGYSVNTVVRPAFVYGGGARLELRQALRDAPAGSGHYNQGASTHRPLSLNHQIYADLRADGRRVLSLLTYRCSFG